MNLLNLLKGKKSESSNSGKCDLMDRLVQLQLLQVKYCDKYHISISTQCNNGNINYITVSIHVFEDGSIVSSKYYTFNNINTKVDNKEYRDMARHLARCVS